MRKGSKLYFKRDRGYHAKDPERSDARGETFVQFKTIKFEPDHVGRRLESVQTTTVQGSDWDHVNFRRKDDSSANKKPFRGRSQGPLLLARGPLANILFLKPTLTFSPILSND